jgi:hypothetical protein
LISALFSKRKQTLQSYDPDSAPHALPAALEDALSHFGRAPSPGAAQLLNAARSFWTPARVDRSGLLSKPVVSASD